MGRWRNGPRTAELREKLRDVVLAKINAYDVVLAHKSRLAHLLRHLCTQSEKEIKDRVVSFGSQIGNPAVRDVFAGRIEARAANGIDLFNPDDHVMTNPVRIAGR